MADLSFAFSVFLKDTEIIGPKTEITPRFQKKIFEKINFQLYGKSSRGKFLFDVAVYRNGRYPRPPPSERSGKEYRSGRRGYIGAARGKSARGESQREGRNVADTAGRRVEVERE